MKTIFRAIFGLLFIALLVNLPYTKTQAEPAQKSLTSEKLTPFSHLVVKGYGDVNIFLGNECRYVISAPQHILDTIEVSNSSTAKDEEVLVIDIKTPFLKPEKDKKGDDKIEQKPKERSFFKFFSSSKEEKTEVVNPKKDKKKSEIKIDIYMTSLKSFAAHGKFDVELKDRLSADHLVIESYGKNEIELEDVNLDVFEALLNGKSELEVKGTAHRQNIDLLGSSKFDGKDLLGHSGSISANGSSKAKVNLDQHADIIANGASKVKVMGNPQINGTLNGISKIVSD